MSFSIGLLMLKKLDENAFTRAAAESMGASVAISMGSAIKTMNTQQGMMPKLKPGFGRLQIRIEHFHHQNNMMQMSRYR